MLDNIVQGIRYFVQFCLAFNRHNYVVVTSCSSFVNFLKSYIEKWYLPFDPEFLADCKIFASLHVVSTVCGRLF